MDRVHYPKKLEICDDSGYSMKDKNLGTLKECLTLQENKLNIRVEPDR